MSVCQLLEASDEHTLNHLASFLKDRAAKLNSLIPDLAQRGMSVDHISDILCDDVLCGSGWLGGVVVSMSDL